MTWTVLLWLSAYVVGGYVVALAVKDANEGMDKQLNPVLAGCFWPLVLFMMLVIKLLL